jgi:hypothetical protein
VSAFFGPASIELRDELINRTAESNGGRYVKEFARQMFNQLGMRVFVLSAHHDTNGTLSIARYVYLSFYPSYFLE